MKRLSCFIGFLCCWPMGLWAQSLNDTLQVKEVVIYAPKTELQQAGNLQLLDSLSLEKARSKTLGTVLSEQSGIFIKTYGIGSLATLSFRGTAASQSGIFWNGLPLNASSNGLFDLSLLPLPFFDEIGINYGGSSLEDGAGGFGGSLRLNNRPDFAQRLQIKLRQSVGSFGQYNSVGDVQIGDDRWQSRSRIFYQQAENDFPFTNLGKEGFPEERLENADFVKWGGMQELYFKPKEDQVFNASAWYLKSDRNLPSIMTLNNQMESQVDELLRLGLGWKRERNKSRWEVQSAYHHESLLYTHQQNGIETETKSWGINNLVQQEWQINNNWRWLNKAHADLEKLENESLEADQVQQYRLAAYSDLTYQKERFQIKAFMRFEQVEEMEQSFLPGIATALQLWQQKAWWLKASLAYNAHYPTLNDRYWQPGGNPDLRRETSISGEIQLLNEALSWRQHRFEVGGTAFYNYIEDYIQWRPTRFGFWTAENIGTVASRGAELQFNYRWAFQKHQIQWRNNYTYTVSTNESTDLVNDESQGKQLFYVPEHLGNSQLWWIYQHYQLGLTYVYNGLRYTTTDNSDFLPANYILNLELSYRWKQQKSEWELSIECNNLFDHDYQAIEWRAMPGRNFLFHLQYRFLK